MDKQVYDVTFAAMTPVEHQGSFEWDGNPEEALEGLKNYLFGVYGKDKFKIIELTIADGERDQLIKLPLEPQNSKEVH